MGRYALNLPTQLKHDAEEWAARQGVSLNQFVLWAVAEKVGELRQGLDDPKHPHVTYRRGAAGDVEPVVRGTRIHVKFLHVMYHTWGLAPEEIAQHYDMLTLVQVKDALAFAEEHRAEIEASLAVDEALERAANG